MRYVMFMIPAVHGTDGADEMPSAEMMKYNSELAEAGILEALNGLHPPGLGVRLLFGPEGPVASSTRSEGAVGRYWIIDVDSHEAAVAWASRCPAQDGDILELRRIQEIENSPEDARGAASGLDI